MTRAMGGATSCRTPSFPLRRRVANTTSGELATALAAVRARVERGDTLAAALADHPTFFSPIYVVSSAPARRAAIFPAVLRVSPRSSRETKSCATRSSPRRSIRFYSASPVESLSRCCCSSSFHALPNCFRERVRRCRAPQQFSSASPRPARKFWPLFLTIPVALIAGIAWALKTPEGSRAYAKRLVRTPLLGTFRRHVLRRALPDWWRASLRWLTLLNALDDAFTRWATRSPR